MRINKEDKKKLSKLIRSVNHLVNTTMKEGPFATDAVHSLLLMNFIRDVKVSFPGGQKEVDSFIKKLEEDK